MIVVTLGCVLSACARAVPGAPDRDRGGEIRSTLLALDADGSAVGGHAAMSDEPVHLGAFAGWYGQGDSDNNSDDGDGDGEAPAGSTYVVVTGSTGCRVPAGVEVSRAGADLVVRFAGGVDRPECVRPIGPLAYLAVPGDAVAGVRTVNGERPLDAAGPGLLVDFVSLGGRALAPVTPAELGTAAAVALRDRLVAASPEHAAEVTTALSRPVADGRRAFAFVPQGCVATGAVLLVGQDRITADLIEPEVPVACDAPASFVATFVVDAGRVPESATLGG